MFRFVVLSALLACAFGGVIPNGLVPHLDGRIVGGMTTTIEEFPHQVSMRYYGSHRCGGSIIKPNVIVSAAHCIEGISTSPLSIVAGSTYRTTGGVERKVNEMAYNAGYSSTTYNYDIAVLILEAPFEYTNSIQPISLAKASDDVREGTKALVSGWGALTEGGSAPSNLQVVEVAIINQADCNRAYSGGITNYMICAGTPTGGKDACQGDSGGPLISGGELVGVVSWGYGCARKEYPGVYARVATLRGWIEQNS